MKKSLYWAERIQKQNRIFYQKSTKEVQKELRKIYDEQGRKLYNEINSVFLKMLSDSENKEGKIFLNDLYRTNRYHILLNYFNSCAKAIGGKQIKITQQQLISAYNYARKVVEEQVPKGMIHSSFLVPSAMDPKQVIRQAWCIDGKTFSDRIWISKNKLVQSLEGSLTDFLMRGISPYQVSKDLVKRLAVDQSSAYRLARTETAHAQITGQVSKYKQMGFTHGRFKASDPCDDCGELDGQIFTLDQLNNLLPRHPNCECSFLLEV